MEEAKKKKPPAEVGNLYKEFVNLFVRSKNGGAAAYKLGQEEWKELKFRGKDEEGKMMLPTGALKPMLIVNVDGGPDENPRFPKTLSAWSRVFKTYNLDVVMVACFAPGLSAYNIVERRMAPLSHDLSGLILLHNAFGNHLDSRGYTVDMELEKKNFQHAGEALAEVWSKTVIDGQPVIAEYLNPDSAKMELQCPSDAWRLKHVLQTQYCLQIVK